MREDDHPASVPRHRVILLLLGTCLALSSAARAGSASVSDSTPSKTGTVVDTHSEKKVVQTGRWMVIRQFTVNLEVKCSDHIYCGEVTTTITNEVDDLMASKGQSVECSESGHDIDLTLKNGRKVKAHQVSTDKC
ncbi:MAG TPA: hypothetical protein VE779_17995, partial [Candidatus Angelobacter sp.]|nr:hypothetical protein [Candidatus Angelobacter sp.]